MTKSSGQRYFEYDDEAIAYLKAKDAKLAQAIDAVGHVYRELDEDLFSSVIHTIIGQQISTAAHRTVWKRMVAALGEVTPITIDEASIDELQSCGMTFRKAEYIKDFAHKVITGAFDLDAVATLDDKEAIEALCTLKGIGEWTAEMLLLFCLNRMDVLSFGDLGIHRGMRMVYHHRRITREKFEKYRRRFSPYGSVASLYFWAISHRDVPGYDRDFAPMTDAQKRAARKRRAEAKATEVKTKAKPRNAKVGEAKAKASSAKAAKAKGGNAMGDDITTDEASR